MNLVYNQLEKNHIPHFLIRTGIRQFLKSRLQEQQSLDEQKRNEFIHNLKQSQIALNTNEANEQHYEVPEEFYKLVLGKNLKYSCGYWLSDNISLTKSESNMLDLYCQRANVKDGMTILDLGCGWGSLTLYLAKRFPNSTITAISNSKSQREYILAKADSLTLKNIQVFTVDINDFSTDQKFDRVISIEMFEHMRNYQLLMQRISQWLKPSGKLFVHIFCHKDFAYPFEVDGKNEWMAKHFFTGGIMPSKNLLRHFQDDLHLNSEWQVNGTHYQKTCEAWLKNLMTHKKQVLRLFEKDMSKEEALKKYCHWKVFFMACAETFGFNSGKEWFVSHYLFSQKTN